MPSTANGNVVQYADADMTLSLRIKNKSHLEILYFKI